MNNLLELLKRLYSHLFFVFLLGVSLSLYFNTTYYQKAKISALTHAITGVWNKQLSKIDELFTLRSLNAELLNENLALRNRIEGYRQRLKSILDDTLAGQFDSMNYFEFFPARVINNSVNNQHNYLTLDVGENDGVEQGMGVVCRNGVVGVVAATTSHFSSVISLLNTDLQVSAMHKNSGAFGSLSWDGVNYRRVILSEIPLHINVSKGDTIITSGYSAIFPKNTPIGRIVDYHAMDGSFMSITVELFADFKTIRKVYIIRSHVKQEIESVQQKVN